MIHQRTHPNLDVDGCYGCKISSIRIDVGQVVRERNGTDVTGGQGTAEYVRRMYAKRRAAGQPDPVPENAKAARYAPAAGVNGGRKYREINGGL